MIQNRALRNQSARAAIHRDAFEVATRILSRRWDFVEVENQVVGDEQIKAAIAVVVYPRATSAPALPDVQQSRCLRHIGESAVPVVAVKYVLRPTGNEEILVPVVVVIADGYAACPALTLQASLRGYV